MTRNRRGATLRRARMLTLAFVLFCTALFPFAAIAGKEGIYISDSAYFTLEKVRLSEASDDSILRFAVRLHNGGTVPIDYNGFGVRVTDADGYSYSAQLTGQQSARVQPGKEQEFAYEARVPKGSRADQLSVVLFAWSYGASISMNDLGAFSVTAAMEAAAEAPSLAIVPLAKADSTMSSDDKVEFRIGSEYFVYEHDDWNLYIDLIAQNTGSAGFVLPAGLKMRLEDAAGQTVPVTAIDGTDKSLLPGKPQRISVRAAIPAEDSASDWLLQFYYTDGTTPVVLDSMAAGKAFRASSIGDASAITDAQGQQTLSVKVDSAVVSQSAEGQWVSAKVIVGNTGGKVAAMPKLTAKVQAASGGVTVAAEDPSAHAAYLSPNESETFTFSALMPAGVDISDMQLALFENRSGSSSTASNSSNASSGNAANGAGSTGSAGSGSANNANSAASSSKTVPVLIAGLGKATVYSPGRGNDYTIGANLALPLDSKFEVAVAELKLYENDSNGFKTAVAKLKVTNADTTVLSTPDLALELMDSVGNIYSGTRQATAATQLATNSSYLISYSFLMSTMDESEPLLLRVYNAKDAAKVPLGTIRTSFQQDNLADDVWDVYPYSIHVREKSLLHGLLNTTFSYTLRLELDLQRTERIISDANLSKLQFELVDSLGQVISVQTIGFLGTTRLVNGTNELLFSNLRLNQFSSNNYVNAYEIVETPNGTVKRKLAEFR